MNKLINYISASIGFVLLVSIIGFSIPKLGLGTTPTLPPADVRVVNTTTNPVPTLAQGTTNVAVQNTPSVNAQESGPWNVGITGTPNVAVPGGIAVSNTPTVHLDSNNVN